MEFENLTLDRCIEMWKKENKHVTIHAGKITGIQELHADVNLDIKTFPSNSDM